MMISAMIIHQQWSIINFQDQLETIFFHSAKKHCFHFYLAGLLRPLCFFSLF